MKFFYYVYLFLGLKDSLKGYIEKKLFKKIEPPCSFIENKDEILLSVMRFMRKNIFHHHF